MSNWNNHGGEYMIPSGSAMTWVEGVHGTIRPYDVHNTMPLPEGMAEYVSERPGLRVVYKCIPFDVVFWQPGVYILPMGLAGPLVFNVPKEGRETPAANPNTLKAIHAFLTVYENG